MKRIVIVGGGYAGTVLARTLDPVAEVELIELKEAFIHNVAAIRAVVDPAWLNKLILPYGRLLKRGRVLRDRVAAIEGRSSCLGRRVGRRHLSCRDGVQLCAAVQGLWRQRR